VTELKAQLIESRAGVLQGVVVCSASLVGLWVTRTLDDLCYLPVLSFGGALQCLRSVLLCISVWFADWRSYGQLCLGPGLLCLEVLVESCGVGSPTGLPTPGLFPELPVCGLLGFWHFECCASRVWFSPAGFQTVRDHPRLTQAVGLVVTQATSPREAGVTKKKENHILMVLMSMAIL